MPCNLLLLAWPIAACPSPPIAPVDILAADLAAGRVVVASPSAEPLATGTWLLLAADTVPLGCFRRFAQEGGRATFFRTAPPERLPGAALRAWLIAPDLVARLAAQWPGDAALNARIDRVGPGARSVWIRAGSNHGVEPGMSWWQRIGGQPVARYDVRCVEPKVCFCAAVPLAADLLIRGGEQVALWPSPGERRRGAAHTAVAFVAPAAGATVAWLAAPSGVVCPREAHVDFHRDDRYVGHGVVEAQDELFWYARFVAAAPAPSCDVPVTQPASAPVAVSSAPASGAAPASRPATWPATASAPATQPGPEQPNPPGSFSPAQVGDTAVIRTQADIERRRFGARVFEVSASGALIAAGEADGVRLGDTGRLCRSGAEVGQVRVVRAQRSYSIVTALGDDCRVEPRLGDDVRFGPLPPLPSAVAELERVVDETLFVARVVREAEVPLLTPLAVRSAGRTIGVAVLVARDAGRTCGFVVGCSLTGVLRPGAVLVPGGEDDAESAGR